MCEKYDYIALSLSGKYTSSWISNPGAIEVIGKMLNIAKENECKVHGLGFTKFNKFKNLKFYSVDSTTWISSMKFGLIVQFDGNGMKKVKRPGGTKMINPKLRLEHGFNEWVKFQKYADKNL